MVTYLSEGIKPEGPKPLLRADLGSPNMAHSTRRLIRDLQMVLSPGRPSRPTDNGRQECWYRMVKQEEIYCYPTYPTVEITRFCLAGIFTPITRRDRTRPSGITLQGMCTARGIRVNFRSTTNHGSGCPRAKASDQPKPAKGSIHGRLKRTPFFS